MSWRSLRPGLQLCGFEDWSHLYFAAGSLRHLQDEIWPRRSWCTIGKILLGEVVSCLLSPLYEKVIKWRIRRLLVQIEIEFVRVKLLRMSFGGLQEKRIVEGMFMVSSQVNWETWRTILCRPWMSLPMSLRMKMKQVTQPPIKVFGLIVRGHLQGQSVSQVSAMDGGEGNEILEHQAPVESARRPAEMLLRRAEEGTDVESTLTTMNSSLCLLQCNGVELHHWICQDLWASGCEGLLH